VVTKAKLAFVPSHFNGLSKNGVVLQNKDLFEENIEA